MKLTILCLFTLLALATCKSSTNNNQTTKLKDTTYIDSKGNKYQYLGKIPDSLRTNEQKEYLIKLYGVISKYLVVENNHEVFKLSKQMFLAKGLSERDYDLMQKGVRENNAFIDSNGIKNFDRTMEKSRLDLMPLLKDTLNKKN